MSNRKEQIINSAGGLAANLFEKFDKLRKQQQQQQINDSSISFHKNASNQTIASTTTNSLLVIDDDDLDDTNLDETNSELKTKQVLIKSYSSSTTNNTADKQVISQSQSDYDLNNNTDSAVVANRMTTSSSLFKLSSGFLDDLMLKKTDLMNKTNSVVDEAEDALRRKFFLTKKKSADSITSTTAPTTPSQVEAPIIPPEPAQQQQPHQKQPHQQQHPQQVNELVVESKEDIQEIEIQPLNVKYALLIPIVCSILICLFMRSISGHNSMFFIVIFYLCGLFTGCLLTACLIAFLLLKYNLLNTKPNKIIKAKGSAETQLHSLLIQTAIQKQSKLFDGVYKGWMNELREPYDPDTYFLNKTRSVYVNLDGAMLRLQTTVSRVPKRAVHGEKIGNVQFNEQRIYDLTDCECFLLPSELVRKRYWSKKYPLCLKGVKLQSSKSNPIRRKSSTNLSTSPSNYEQMASTANLINQSLNLATDDSVDEAASQQLDNNTLILFARTDREKEEWFKLFKKSAANHLTDSTSYSSQKRQNSSTSKLLVSQQDSSNLTNITSGLISYDTTNDKLLYKLSNEVNKTNQEVDTDTDNSSGTQTDTGLLYDTSLNFMNTFLIRMFSDFFTHQFWVHKIRTKIQNKLNTLKMPYFMEELRIIDLDLGFMIPLIKQTSEPWYDEKGLWCHLDIDYSGGVQILISTKLNLMKLKSNEQMTISNEIVNEPNTNHKPKKKRLHLGMINSDEEDSPESSGDEYVHTGFNNDDEANKIIETSNKGKKIMNIVNKIASSNYFQKATEIKYIKKAMENVSNCQLLLNVEVKKIVGTIALNIPPHPSDRIWYGFVTAPQMVLSATPQVGDKEVSYSAISDWIADKLKSEFQKVLVFPNMDDFYIPILNSELEYKNW